MHQLQGAEGLFNVWSLWLTKACPAEAVKCAEQEMDIFKQTEEPQLCEASFPELRTCQTRAWFPEIHRNPGSDGFLGSSTAGLSSHVLQLLLGHLWLDPGHRGETGGELQLCPLLQHRPSEASAASPINQDSHTAPPGRAAGRTNSQAGQTAKHGRAGQERSRQGTEGSLRTQAAAPGVLFTFPSLCAATGGC